MGEQKEPGDRAVSGTTSAGTVDSIKVAKAGGARGGLRSEKPIGCW